MKIHRVFTKWTWCSLLVLVLLSFPACDVISEVASTDAAEITAAVDGFHRALAQGEREAALALLAPDAVILESGDSQTRAEYEREHLAEDIAFARATTTERSPLQIQQHGNVAWTIATSRTTGTFKDRKIDNVSAELIVLTKEEARWRIRTISLVESIGNKGDDTGSSSATEAKVNTVC